MKKLKTRSHSLYEIISEPDVTIIKISFVNYTDSQLEIRLIHYRPNV